MLNTKKKKEKSIQEQIGIPNELMDELYGDGGPHNTNSGKTHGTGHFEKSCSPMERKSPQNLHLPFSPDLSSDLPTLKYKGTNQVMISKWGDGYFKAHGKFGYIKYAGKKYKVAYVLIKGPSEHKIQNRTVALEVQIYHKKVNERTIIISVMFEETKKVNLYNAAIEHFGLSKLNKDELSQLSPSGKDTAGANTTYEFDKKNPDNAKLNLKLLFANMGVWIMYSGSETNGECQDAKWFISYQPLRVHKDQLQNFRNSSKPYYGISEKEVEYQDLSHNTNAINIKELQKKRKRLESQSRRNWKPVPSNRQLI